MRVLLVHNYYQQPGGEDVVFRAEQAMLSQTGHEVQAYTVSNDELTRYSPLGMAARTIWNGPAARQLADLVRRERIEVVHFHNTFSLLSPAVYAAVRAAGAATVQTLHNYRLLCANALLFRDGHVCESCLGRLPLPAVRYRCYRDSVGASATVAAMQVTHRLLGTYRHQIDAYITLTEFARQKFIEGGLPGARLHVKPNFLEHDPGMGPGGGGYALYVGRLTPEKGIRTVLEAWRELGRELPLKIVGYGPLAEEVEQVAGQLPGVEWLGRRERSEVMALAGAAECLIFPSEWYEGFPMTIVEAFAVGLPVISSRVGAMSHLIRPGETGRHFTPGDARDLAAEIRAFLQADRQPLRQQAREEFLRHYTSDENVRRLLYIYEQAKSSHVAGVR